MRKTTVIENPATPVSLSESSKNNQGRPIRYLFAAIPFILVLLISTSYQQNHHDVSYFERDDFAPEVKDSLKKFLMSVSLNDLPFTPGDIEWAFLKDFYRENGYRPVWIHLNGLDDGAGQLIELIERSRELGLEPENYHYAAIKKLVSGYESKLSELHRILMDFNIEIMLSDAAFRMMFHLHSGYQHVDSAFLSERAFNFSNILMKGITDNRIKESIRSVEPEFIEYQNLCHAVARFVTSNSLNNPDYQPVSRDSSDQVYRYRVLALNLDRLRKRNYSDSRMLYVNIPSYSLRIFDHNQLADTFRVIVGSPSSPTPQLSANLETVIANPVWYVPRSIAIDEILPKLKNDSNYLEKNGFSVLDRHYRAVDPKSIGMESIDPEDFDYTFRQKRGSDNSLGKAKFLFSNPYSVYLHDTPGKALFSKEKRALSHGCIRLQHPERLANYILSVINSDTTRFENLMENGLHKEFKLNSPLAIHITYITCEANAAGEIAFYNDIYGIDGKELEVLALYMNDK